MANSLKPTFKLRPIQSDDSVFLFRLYASTRQKELDVVPWTDGQKKQFLEQQFKAQSTFYRDQFPEASFQVITANDRPIGRLYVDSRADEIRIVDIALLPEFRGQGIGTHLLTEILAEAKAQNKMVRIHVESQNPALSLYRRLGFGKISENGVYFLMEAKP